MDIKEKSLSIKLNRKCEKKPLRKAITYDDLCTIIYSKKLKSCSKITHCRFVAASVILFFTGMRVSEVALLTIDDVKTLSQQQFALVKRPKTNDYHKYFVSKKASEEFNNPIFLSCLTCIFKNQKILKGFATTKAFSRSLNKYLKIYLKPQLNKPISSHSFRIGYLTSLLSQNQISVQDASKLIGHKHIETTLLYYRFFVSEELLNKLNDCDIKRISSYKNLL
jgi:site-specific recombinase XerD